MPKPLVVCICGTDTDAGKTVVTAGLLAAMRGQGVDARALKPVQTGCLPGPGGELLAPDVLVYRQAAPGAPASALVCLEETCSPHLAARRSGLTLDVAGLSARIAQYAADSEVLLVEAAGGLLAPLNGSESMADLFAALNRELGALVVLVAANRLGALNHALLSLEVLRARGLEPAGVIMCDTSPGGAEDSLESEIRNDNLRFIRERGRVPCLALLPYFSALEEAGASGNEPEGSSDDRFCMPSESAVEYSSDTKPTFPNLSELWDEIARLLGPAASALLREHDRVENSAMSQESLTKMRDLLDFDRDHLWHPYTSALTPLKAWEANATQGAYIHLRFTPESDQTAVRRNSASICDAGVPIGTTLISAQPAVKGVGTISSAEPLAGWVLDGMSSWWAAIHGYNHPTLVGALRRQANLMPHVMFGGITHEPAVELCKLLLELAPPSMEHVFLADSGSVSVEVAMKMAVQYQQATGNREKSSILTVCGGYHGDTLGAMSVCDPVNGMHGLFSGILPRQIFAPRPECRFDSPFDPASLDPLERLFAENSGRVAAVMIEPIVQGAGGMWFYHPQYLAGLRELCDRHGALLILDEIATGFGRTGRMFACEWAGIEPDVMCVGKALTGGVMTLAAALASRKVALGISREGGVLMHGPTFMGNPLACAVARASLKLLVAFPWRERVARMEELMRAALAPCRSLPGVRDVRVLGAIGVVEMEDAVNVEALQDFFVRTHGVWIRPFGRLIYVMPPYVVSDNELTRLCIAIVDAVEKKKWA